MKSRFDLLKRASSHVKEIRTIDFCCVDVNCRLRVTFHDEKQEDFFSSTFQELCDIIDREA